MLCGLRWCPFIDDPSRIRVDDPYSVLVQKDKRVMLTYPLRVTQESGRDEYFGFVIDGNRRFLLANGVCTHNTITSLSIASTINTRTMVFVNKLVLIDQWLATIYRWFGASTAVQVIQGKSKALVPEKDFYIVNALNVKKHLFTEYEKLGIGLLIVDECHLMMTKIFSQALSYIRPRYLMGLSATPYRIDGFDILLELYFGLHRVIRKLQRPHTVYCTDTNIVIQHDCDGRGDIIWNSVIDKQTSDTERNRLIASTCQKYPDRNILILSKRIKQIEDISRFLQELNESVTVMKENDNTFDEDARILVATFQKVGTGFSHDKLDMLILASDTEEYFIQYLGRVFRRPDVEPIVIDFVDRHPILKKHFQSRKKVYEQSGGVVRYVKM
jgi:superfamily II DNA or RNA helicase